ncbi:MAG TPA: hypothetical protein VM491_05215 [Burkholderiaceae bacterium]|nr:hypothetical protein [Burkholderiaceae bacterium]
MDACPPLGRAPAHRAVRAGAASSRTWIAPLLLLPWIIGCGSDGAGHTGLPPGEVALAQTAPPEPAFAPQGVVVRLSFPGALIVHFTTGFAIVVHAPDPFGVPRLVRTISIQALQVEDHRWLRIVAAETIPAGASLLVPRGALSVDGQLLEAASIELAPTSATGDASSAGGS